MRFTIYHFDALNTFHKMNHYTCTTINYNTTRLKVQCVHYHCDWKCQTILYTR